MWKIVQMFPGKAEMEIKKELMNTSLLGTVLPYKKIKILVSRENETKPCYPEKKLRFLSDVKMKHIF